MKIFLKFLADWPTVAPGGAAKALRRALAPLKPGPAAADSRAMLNPFRSRTWVLPPVYARWESLRRPQRHTDEALTGTTRAWLRRLPAGRRPLQLCMLYPRVANGLAWHWRDPVRTHQLLDDLLIDRRGGRRGFPRPVVAELRRLREFSGHPDQPAQASGYWDSLRQAWS